ncbi:uncharacterized protein LOC144607585 isoform X2 [Rhinoraja longicauda]
MVRRRGKRLLEKVIKNNECGVGNSTLANARSWGVKILHLDDLLAYFEKRGVKLLNTNRKTLGNGQTSHSAYKSTKVEKLKHPFLKIEDSSRHFKPLYHQFVDYPEPNYKSHGGHSAFEHRKKSKNGYQDQEKSKLGVCRMTDSEGDVETLTKPADLQILKKRHRFCECCHEAFHDLAAHLHSKQHQDFASNPSHFNVLDDIMSRLTNEFVECQSNGSSQRSTKTASNTAISLSKMYVESLQAVTNFVLEDGEQDHSLDSVSDSLVINLPFKNLEQVEMMGQDSKLQQVKLDRKKEDTNMDGSKHNRLQQDHDQASVNYTNGTDRGSKQLVVKLLDFRTDGEVAFHESNDQLHATIAHMEDASFDANKEGSSETCRQEKQEHMNSAPEEILSCVKAFPEFQKVDCDAYTIGNKCNFKKRKRSNDASSQNENSPRPRLDDLSEVCNVFTFFKSTNSFVNNLSQAHTELFYLSDVDKTFTSTCFQQSVLPTTYSMNISMGEHFDLSTKLNLDKPSNIKEGREDLQTKTNFKNMVNLQGVWNCEEKQKCLSNTTTINNQEVSEDNQFVKAAEIAFKEKVQLKVTLSNTTDQDRNKLLSTAPNTEDFVSPNSKVVLDNEIILTGETKLGNTHKEINPRTAAQSTVMQLTASDKTSTKRLPGYDPFLDSKMDESGCKNSVNFCHFAFKNNTGQTDIFSSESEWDIQLPAQCCIIQTNNKSQHSVDMEILRKTCVDMKDAEYETQLNSVLKNKSEVDLISKEGHDLMS